VGAHFAMLLLSSQPYLGLVASRGPVSKTSHWFAGTELIGCGTKMQQNHKPHKPHMLFVDLKNFPWAEMLAKILSQTAKQSQKMGVNLLPAAGAAGAGAGAAAAQPGRQHDHADLVEGPEAAASAVHNSPAADSSSATAGTSFAVHSMPAIDVDNLPAAGHMQLFEHSNPAIAWYSPGLLLEYPEVDPQPEVLVASPRVSDAHLSLVVRSWEFLELPGPANVSFLRSLNVA